MTFENVETQFWVMKAVQRQISSRRANNSKVLMTETVHSIVWYDQLPLSGRVQMLLVYLIML